MRGSRGFRVLWGKEDIVISERVKYGDHFREDQFGCRIVCFLENVFEVTGRCAIGWRTYEDKEDNGEVYSGGRGYMRRRACSWTLDSEGLSLAIYRGLLECWEWWVCGVGEAQARSGVVIDKWGSVK
ncbi:hypothetical protein Tco_0491524 [Tanacetum coccineum]